MRETLLKLAALLQQTGMPPNEATAMAGIREGIRRLDVAEAGGRVPDHLLLALAGACIFALATRSEGA